MTGTLEHTPLYETHVALGARMVPFTGWEMPVQYTGILQEARAVRSHAGLFDVSHMGRIHLEGVQATELLEWTATNRVANLKIGRSRYTCFCNEEGGIIDDAILYRMGESEYLLVCNAGNRERVLSWLKRWAQRKYPDIVLKDRTVSTAMVALHGPQFSAVLDGLGCEDLMGVRMFNHSRCSIGNVPVLASKTGYTGEDGFEITLAGDDAPRLWQMLMDRGATPCGIGARDVLRLEAAFVLHGNDTDTSTTPMEAGLERFVRLDKEFVGVDALRKQAEDGISRQLVGLRIHGREIARKGYPILTGGARVGEVTSGTYSPALDSSIAMGYVSIEYTKPGQTLMIDIRNRPVEAEVVTLPFYSRRRQR